MSNNAAFLKPLWEISRASELWRFEFVKVLPIREYQLEQPFGATSHALFLLSHDSMQTYREIISLASLGLNRPAAAWWRKLRDIKRDIEFIEIAHRETPDETAHRWVHWQINAQSLMESDDPEVQRQSEMSRKLFSDDGSYGQPGCWAVINGRSFAKEADRGKYVANKKRQYFPEHKEYQRLSQELNQRDREMIREANAIIHPAPSVLVEQVTLSWPKLLYSSARNLEDALIALRCGSLDKVPAGTARELGKVMETYLCPNGSVLSDRWCQFGSAIQNFQQSLIQRFLMGLPSQE